MGQQNAKSGSSSLQQLAANYVVEETLKDTNDKILRDPVSGQLFLMKELSLTNTDEFNKALDKLKRRKLLKHEHYFSLQQYFSKSESSFCSIFHKIVVVYQYSNHTLRNQVEARIHEEKFFDEKEVWSILCSCSLALSFLLKSGIEYSVVSPEEIYLTQEGVIKMIDPQLSSVQMEFPNKITYYAPELLNNNNNTSSAAGPKNHKNSSIFSLGMCILEIMLLQPMSICYDFEQFVFKAPEFQSCLERINGLEIYSESLKKVVAKMLVMTPVERLGVQQLQQYLLEMVEGTISQESTQTKKYTDTDTVQQKIFSEPEVENQVLSHPLLPIEAEPEEKQDLLCGNFELDTQNPDEAEGDNDQCITDRSSSQAVFGAVGNNPQVSVKSYSDENTGSFKQTTKIPKFATNQSSSNINSAAPLSHFGTFMPFKQNVQPPSLSPVPTFNTNGLFTDPKLLDMCRQDLAIINLKRSKVGQEPIPLNTNYADSQFTLNNRNTPKNQIASFGGSLSMNKPQTSVLSPIVVPQVINTLSVEWQPMTNNKPSNNPSIASIVDIKGRQSITNAAAAAAAADFQKYAHNESRISNGSMRSSRQSAHNQNQQDNYESSRSKQNLQQENYNQYHYKSQQEQPNFSQFSSLADIARSSEPDRPCFNKKAVKQADFDNQSHVSREPQLKYVNEVFQKGRYEGQKLNGMRHGEGTFYYKEGGKYSGQWYQNKMHGKGVLYYYNQKVAYDGEWKDDQLHGYGVLYNEDPKTLSESYDYTNWDEVDEYWIKYEGHFEDDNKSGQGKLVLSNGEVFEGNFSGDEVNGEGIFYCLDGTVVHGLWENNKLVEEY